MKTARNNSVLMGRSAPRNKGFSFMLDPDDLLWLTSNNLSWFQKTVRTCLLESSK